MTGRPTNKPGKASTFLWSFLEQGGSKAIQLVVQIILARLLSPEAFGILAILLVVTQVTDSVAQSGLGMTLIQNSDADDGSYSTAWWLSLGLASVLYCGVPFGAGNLRLLQYARSSFLSPGARRNGIFQLGELYSAFLPPAKHEL